MPNQKSIKVSEAPLESPPLSVCSLRFFCRPFSPLSHSSCGFRISLKTLLDEKTHRQEIVVASCTIHNAVRALLSSFSNVSPSPTCRYQSSRQWMRKQLSNSISSQSFAKLLYAFERLLSLSDSNEFGTNSHKIGLSTSSPTSPKRRKLPSSPLSTRALVSPFHHLLI